MPRAAKKSTQALGSNVREASKPRKRIVRSKLMNIHRESTPRDGDFPIIGIGCSAGGLEALDAFLSHIPESSGMAYVIVQHLDPNQPSHLPSLLQRNTSMSVYEACQHMAVEPNCVYVIPPNKDIALLHGVLQLSAPTERRGLRLPIDFFLRSLAEDRQEKAIGVILSGMGSDGMLGLGAIKEKSGLTLVQEPRTAKAGGMPNSAIQAKVADVVAPPEELPGRIIDYLSHTPQNVFEEPDPESIAQSSLSRIIMLLRKRSGNDFSLYKTSCLYRRIERRIALLQIGGIAEYVRYLRDNPQELDLLFKELLIGVTSFFRDPVLWDFLGRTAIPALLARHPDGKTLRAWVAACSSGEEAYSLAIVFREVIERLKPEGQFTLQVYATDLDADAVDVARKGLYPGNIAADVSPERLSRHFVSEDGCYRICKDVREMVIFAQQNIISDPPFTRLDILSCRNLLIYFGQELQKKLLPVFHYTLNRDGLLILGKAETVGNFTDRFSPVDKTNRIFARLDQTSQPFRPTFCIKEPSGETLLAERVPLEYRESMDYLIDQIIQQNYAPAAVLVNGDGDILFFSGRTGKYLEPAAGKVNVNIHAMAREGLRDALSGVIRNALLQTQPIHLDGLEVGTNGGRQMFNVTVQGIEKPELLRNRVLVVFTDVVTPAGNRKSPKTLASGRESALAQELKQAREALRITHEEMQTSVEETKSANEELQASNEELTTSKEELQSLNEELQTVNSELQSKVDDLTWAKNDMANLLNSTEIATIFLDNQMKLRRFTTYATHLFKFIPADVGRPLSDIVSDLDYPQLMDDAEAVLATLVFREKQVATRDGRWYRARIMPYRTQDNVIDGVVITFVDITEIKLLEARLRKPER